MVDFILYPDSLGVRKTLFNEAFNPFDVSRVSVFRDTNILTENGKMKKRIFSISFASQTCNEGKLNFRTSQQPIDNIIFIEQSVINDLYALECGIKTIFDIL